MVECLDFKFNKLMYVINTGVPVGSPMAPALAIIASQNE